MSLVTTVLDNKSIFSESKYDEVMERLKTVKCRNKSNMEDQVARIFAITKLIRRKERVNLNPNNPIAKDFLDRAYVRELKDGILTHYTSSLCMHKGVISKNS